MLTPIVKLVLRAGIGFSEFSSLAKAVFVHVAADDYGVRGRPTNLSRISAMTGISRKEAGRIRDSGLTNQRWTPNLEANPANTVIHHWHYDPDFCSAPGRPRPLPFEGAASFSSLVSRYAGDIPPGAIRTELNRVHTIEEDQNGFLHVQQRYFSSGQFNEDLIRRIAFSLANLGNTVAFNAALYRSPEFTFQMSSELGRVERAAWTEHLSHESAIVFRSWIREEAIRFVESADGWLGQHELPRAEWDKHPPRSVGIGVYYFEEDN